MMQLEMVMVCVVFVAVAVIAVCFQNWMFWRGECERLREDFQAQSEFELKIREQDALRLEEYVGIKGVPEHVVFSIKNMVDLMDEKARANFWRLMVMYELKFGGLNVDRQGNKYTVLTRDSKGRFV